MGKRAPDIAKLILEAEPDAFAGDPAAIERVTLALAKINAAIPATTLVRQGEDALDEAVQKIAKAVELEARHTASMMLALEDDTGDPPDTINWRLSCRWSGRHPYDCLTSSHSETRLIPEAHTSCSRSPRVSSSREASARTKSDGL
jgi:hypothetical protein